MREGLIKKRINNKIFYLLFGFLTLFNCSITLKIIANENSFNKQEISTLINDEYILDTGDELMITFEDLNPFENLNTPSYRSLIDREGYLSIPELGKIYVRGLSLDSLQEKINTALLDVMYNPNVEISIERYRTIQVYLGGEIRRPGLYKLNSFSSSSNGTNVQMPFSPPRLFDALKEGQGITEFSDLSKIRIIRNISDSNGGGKKEAFINLLKLLESGDQDQNIIIRDGDYIFIQKSDQVITDQILAINKTNLTPDQIMVFINGNVSKRGKIILPQGTSLYEAILAAGGQQLFSGKIEFIRLDKKNRTTKRSMKYETSTPKGSKNNPLLMEGDIIIVRQNILGKTNRLLSEFTAPIISGIGLYGIFK